MQHMGGGQGKSRSQMKSSEAFGKEWLSNSLIHVYPLEGPRRGDVGQIIDTTAAVQ